MKTIDENTAGLVFDIEEFAVFDGPGIRCAVFLKGCPLRCTWCANPETQSFQPELAQSLTKCIGQVFMMIEHTWLCYLSLWIEEDIKRS